MEIAHPLNYRLQSRTYLTILILSGIVFFLPFLGRVHLFDWDEINFAESAREMIVTGNYHRVQINFQPFWEKPPLFFWLQALSMKAFGINEFAARLPNAVFGIITLVTLFYIGRKYQNPLFGFLWAISLFGAFLPHLYFKSGIIDPVFNYFIFLGIYCMFRSLQAAGRRAALLQALLAGLCIGLSTLTKGPVGLLIFLICFLVYFLLGRFRNFPRIGPVLAFTGMYIVVCCFWFAVEVAEHGLWFLRAFLSYQVDLFLHPVASHGEPFYYHFVVVAIGCFPISVLALPAMFRSRPGKQDFKRLMKILFWTVMILFSLTTTKIVHYSSLTYLPLAFLAAVYLHGLFGQDAPVKKYVLVLLVAGALVFSLLLAAIPYLAMHPALLTPYLHDAFAVASLQVPVAWTGYESLTGIVYFLLALSAVILFARREWMKAVLFLCYSTAGCLLVYLVTVVPRIERYSQGPAIDFYESLQGQNVYVWPIGFKSYAQYFYAKKPPLPAYGAADEDFLLRGKITRPAWFVVKVTNSGFDSTCSGCILKKQEGGFRFYERLPPP